MRIMYDGISPERLPNNGAVYASYIDGKWPNYPALVKRFPHAICLSIAVDPAHDADILDVERYDATPGQAPGWVARQRARGNSFPWVYMSAAAWGDVKQAFQSSGIESPFYWVADYDNGPTIPAGAVGIQWKNTPGYDQSAIADNIPGLDSDDVSQADVIAALESDKGQALLFQAIWNSQKWGTPPNTYPPSTYLVNANKYAGYAFQATNPAKIAEAVVAALPKTAGNLSVADVETAVRAVFADAGDAGN